MPCQTQTSQQPQQPTAVLPQNLPQTQADWSRFLQRMNGLFGAVNNAQYATGVNAVPTEFAVYDGTGLPALRITGATSAFDTTKAQFGSGSLKLTATASTVTVELASSGYPITLHPDWQWIGSLFLLTTASTIAGKLSVVTAVKQYDVDISGSPGTSWARLYGDYDLTADASTSCTMLLTLTGVTVGQVFNLEGWMLEPSQGAVLPSPFIMTSGPRTWTQVVNDGLKPDNNANYVAGVVGGYVTQTSFAAGLQAVNIVSALPTLPSSTYPDGSLVVLTSDHKLYRNDANTWTKAVDGADLISGSVAQGALGTASVIASNLATGSVTSSALAASSVDATKFASGQAPIAVGSTLPSGTGYTGPVTFFNTTDQKIYRYDAATSSWTKAVDGGDITAGTITAGAISAGAITSTAIAAGAITANAIAANAIYTGAIQAGAVTSSQLAANSVTAGAISAGAINANAIAAGAVTTTALAANAVTASAIAAGAVTATAINVTTLSAISANLGTVTAGTLEDSAGHFVINLAATTQTIKDGSGSTRVLIGNLGTDYGIQVFSSTGAKIFDASQGAWDATNNQPVVTTATNAQATANSATSAASTAQTTANTANTLATQAPIINGGFDATPYGTGWTMDSQWTVKSDGLGPGAGPGYAQFTPNGSPGAIYNSGRVGVVTGQTYKAQGLIRGSGTPDGSAYVRIRWLDASGNQIAYKNGNVITGNVTTGSYAVDQAPSGAYYAATSFEVDSCTTGTYQLDNVVATLMPSSVDEVPDGSAYFRTAQASQSESVDNASFEATTSLPPPGWFGTGALSYVTAYPYSGSQSLNLYTTAQYQYAKSTRIYRCIPGEVWSVSAAILCGSGEAWQFGLDLQGGSGGLPGIVPIADGAWHINTLANYTIPAGITGFRIVLFSNNPSGAHTAALDDVKLVRVRSLDNEVADGSTYLRMPGANMDSNRRGLIDFTQSGHLGKNVDNIADGTTYARIYGSELSSGKHRIGVAGSGYRVGDQRNLPAVTVSNYGSGWSGLSLSYSATTTSATISASAATLQEGSNPISYNASSVTVSGSAGTTVPYYLYYQDPTHAGGSQTLYASTSQITALSNDGNVLLASLSVTFPASGTGSGGGTGTCPLRTAWVIKRGLFGRKKFIRAGDVRVGDYLLMCDGRWGCVTHSKAAFAQCVRVHTRSGSLGCSVTAPLRTNQGTFRAPDLLGKNVQVRKVRLVDELAHLVTPLGGQWVQHITITDEPDDFYWTGDAKTCLFAHHNLKPP